MKCYACNTENVNDAVYCRECGKELRAARLNERRGTSLTFVMLILSLGVLIATVVLCSSRFKSLFSQAKVSDEQFVKLSSSVLIYAESEKSVTVWSENADSLERKQIKVSGTVQDIVNGSGCAVAVTDSGFCFITEKGSSQMNGCVKYKLSDSAPVCAYITASGKLYKCNGGKPALVSVDVLDFTLSPKGDLYYLRNDISPSDDRKPVDKNGFYQDKKELCYDSDDDKCTEIVCANDFGMYYATENGHLFAVTGKDEKYELDDFESISYVGSESILCTKKNGGTYVWKRELEESMISDYRLLDMIVPAGYKFTGDDYKGLMYTISDENGEICGAVRITEDGESIRLAQGGRMFCTSGDCKKLFCLNDNSELVYTDTVLDREIICCDGVNSYIVVEDGRGAWIATGDGLLFFDGYKTKTVAELNNITELYMADAGYPVIHCKYTVKKGNEKAQIVEELYSFDGKLTEIARSKGGFSFCGACGYGICYVDKKRVHIASAGGEFRTYGELHKKDDTASDTAQSQN